MYHLRKSVANVLRRVPKKLAIRRSYLVQSMHTKETSHGVARNDSTRCDGPQANDTPSKLLRKARIKKMGRWDGATKGRQQPGRQHGNLHKTVPRPQDGEGILPIPPRYHIPLRGPDRRRGKGTDQVPTTDVYHPTSQHA